ncbi:MAG: hypothetical protein IPM54_09155 [Polyangiaceae bacterium]|nr:hypothetical protein [Polyangiaceae bacterium]
MATRFERWKKATHGTNGATGVLGNGSLAPPDASEVVGEAQEDLQEAAKLQR